MSQIFVSYSRDDEDFAERLTASLNLSYEVWMDRRNLEPGAIWERHIEDGIKSCQVFTVIVSPASNESDWVARETLLAERLGRHRIPILVSGGLPLRLLNVQYVDFRGQYEGGLRDLLACLKDRLRPHAQSNIRARQLIGQGIVAHLSGDQSLADNYIAQALSVSTDLEGWSIEQFWARLRRFQPFNLASRLSGALRVQERTTVLEVGNPPDLDTYEWSLQIAAPDYVVDKIDFVDYLLHPTFTPRNQVVRDPVSNFRVVRAGWGTFHVEIDVHFKDGSISPCIYRLLFSEFNDVPLRPRPPRPDP